MWKILNIILYLVTLGLAFGYFLSMKFGSTFVHSIYLVLLIARPALIVLYSLSMLCLESRDKKASNKYRDQ